VVLTVEVKDKVVNTFGFSKRVKNVFKFLSLYSPKLLTDKDV